MIDIALCLRYDICGIVSLAEHDGMLAQSGACLVLDLEQLQVVNMFYWFECIFLLIMLILYYVFDQINYYNYKYQDNMLISVLI